MGARIYNRSTDGPSGVAADDEEDRSAGKNGGQDRHVFSEKKLNHCSSNEGLGNGETIVHLAEPAG
jgi:hypothetical protein